MNKRLILFTTCFLIISCLSLWAADFGLILDQTAKYGTLEDEGVFEYSGSLVPRFSALLGNNSDIYISASIEAGYRDVLAFVPELLRTEFTFHSGNLGLKAGRMYISDPLGFIANGLFDGARVSLDSNLGTFSLGAWYKGLLYKNRANITMTDEEYVSYLEYLDYDDFSNTYFAPRRLVSALSWEHLGMGYFMARLSLLGQFDLANGFDFSANDLLHSQYLVGKISVPVNRFTFDAGAALGLVQSGGESGMALAGELGIAWSPPTSLRQRISLLGRYSSGSGSQFDAFLPITTVAQGEILQAKLSGISMVSLDYVARLHHTLSAGVSSSYFMRSNLAPYNVYPLFIESSNGYVLGNEFFGRLVWSPASDIQLNLGGGIFLPSMGNAAPEADNSWRIELNVVFSLR